MSFAPASVPRISATKLVRASLLLVAVQTLSSASTRTSTGVVDVSLELGSMVSSSWATAFPSRTTVTNLGNLFPVLSSDNTTSCLLILLAAGSQLSNLLSPGRSATSTPSDLVVEKVGHDAQLTKTTALVWLVTALMCTWGTGVRSSSIMVVCKRSICVDDLPSQVKSSGRTLGFAPPLPARPPPAMPTVGRKHKTLPGVMKSWYL
eukprot:1682739-Amphidinium_carterae.4